MNYPKSRALTALFFFLAAALATRAQYIPPSPALPVPGAIDDYLRNQDPTYKAWDFGINERLRSENKSNAGTTHAGSNFDFSSAPPTTSSNDYWLNRLMLRAGYTGDWFSAMVETRTSYSYSDNRYNATAPGKGLMENDGPFQLELAYLTLGNLKKFPLTVKIGRQELTYGDQRLVGSAMWLNTPHTFDAVKVRYQNAFMGADVFTSSLVYTRNDGFNKSNPQDLLSGLYLDFPGLSKNNVIETYVFARNVARGIVTDDWSEVPAPFRFPAPQDIYTIGFRAKSKPGTLGAWDYGIELMGQLGNRTAVYPATPVPVAKTAPRLSQEAYAFVLQTGYTWKDSPWKPRLAFIFSGASGDHSSADKNSETFQNLLPSNHGLYGLMDLSGLQNILDYRLAFSVKPSAKTSLAFDFHQQVLMSTYDYWYNVAGVPRNTPGAAPGSGRGYGINPGYNGNLGQEIDLIAGWTVTRGLLLESGVGHFFRGPYIKESFRAVGSKDADYLYIQATLNL